ncbi:MarR family winged helix-turn-helix transcriptional regulator [Thermomonospora cellulosilytica]|uniref:DNA-binding MarR family transcriptional regulator n=1 Tax=Thermomonospora cellulosilytica TaxID=1411118 RepID=A0A7W3R5U1_9ACTN|nr:MarR family winged helix-turn-helix transcriptional regulator [Thermomonospora cellulosilytica]MBA9001468.1 DNA-binding MarR family transcriptional regulator [Thermomonospora cellulosilytica]
MADKGVSGGGELAAIEQAMVAIRRGQRRGVLAELAGAGSAGRAVFDVLDVIEAAEAGGEAATVGTVAAALGVDQPRASRLVSAAVDAGLVRRVADQADGRRALLERTGEGRALTERVHEHRRRVFAAAMAGWTDAERAEFARLLGRFVAGLGAVSGGGRPRDGA